MESKAGSFARGLEIPAGESAARRSDIELFFDKLPEPIDLELDLRKRFLYWTDRRSTARQHGKPRIIDKSQGARDFAGASDGRDRHRAGCPGDRMFVTDFAGSIFPPSSTDGRVNFLFAQGTLPASLTSKSKNLGSERIHHVECQTYSPSSHHSARG